jgi:uncharacterized protein YodC (DUF2158 family)
VNRVSRPLRRASTLGPRNINRGKPHLLLVSYRSVRWKTQEFRTQWVEDRASTGLSACRWFERFNAAMVGFEEGRPRKVINLEKSQGIVWNET